MNRASATAFLQHSLRSLFRHVLQLFACDKASFLWPSSMIGLGARAKSCAALGMLSRMSRTDSTEYHNAHLNAIREDLELPRIINTTQIYVLLSPMMPNSLQTFLVKSGESAVNCSLSGSMDYSIALEDRLMAANCHLGRPRI